jgi:hypothetical protein
MCGCGDTMTAWVVPCFKRPMAPSRVAAGSMTSPTVGEVRRKGHAGRAACLVRPHEERLRPLILPTA